MESTPSPSADFSGRFLWSLPLAASLLAFGLLLAPDYGHFVPAGVENDLTALEAGDPILNAEWLPPEVSYTPFVNLIERLAGTLGEEPVAFRILDLLLHMGVCVLLYAVLRRLLVDPRVAALAASLFAVLSVHPDTVSSGSGRAQLLSALAVLGTWLLFLRPGHSGRGTLLAFLAGWIVFLGLLASPLVAVALPLVLVSSWLTRRSLPLRGFSAMVSAVLGYWLVRSAALGSTRFLPHYTENPLAWQEWPVRLLNGVALMPRYLLKIVAPVHLSADYSHPGFPILGLDDPLLWGLAVGFIAAAVFVVLYFRRRRPLLALAVLLFTFSLLPFTSLVFPARAVFHERYAYLAALALPIGLCAVVGFPALASHRRVVLPVLALLVVAYGCRTWVRNREWGVPVVLRITREAPQTARSHLTEGEAYLALWGRAEAPEEKERLEHEVKERVEACLAVYPEAPDPHLLLGRLLYNEHEYAEAVERFDKALELYRAREPVIVKPKLYRWRGECNLHLGNSAEALGDLDLYLRISESRATSPDAVTFNVRGLAHAQLSESRAYLEKLAQELSRAGTSTTSMTSSVPTAVSLEEARTSTLQDAFRDFNTAIGLDPGVPEFWNNRGYARFQLGDYEGAIRDYDKGLRIVRDRGILYAPGGESVATFLQRIAEVHLEIARKARQTGDEEKAAEASKRYLEVSEGAARLRAEWERENEKETGAP